MPAVAQSYDSAWDSAAPQERAFPDSSGSNFLVAIAALSIESALEHQEQKIVSRARMQVARSPPTKNVRECCRVEMG
jgi:hypothetical protein